MKRLLLIIAVLAMCQQWATAQATKPDDDAAKLYMQAAKIIEDNADAKIVSSSASNVPFPNYPPYPDDWQRVEKADFAANAPARALAHQARSIEHADWVPIAMNPPGDLAYLNSARFLANDLADAALYQHLQGEDADAIETLRDLWHLADCLSQPSERVVVRQLVSIGIRAMVMHRMEIITASVTLTKDPTDHKALQIDLARELIGQFLDHGDAKALVLKNAHYVETANRVNSECDLAAMSLACHLYRFDTGNWPKSLDDLHNYLPSLPIDPWGDGKQTLGYVLIKSGLPDGSDRPLVYSRCSLKDGFFFRIDEPEYAYYNNDGSGRPIAEQKLGGQFRDVASWAPPAGPRPTPTTRPME